MNERLKLRRRIWRIVRWPLGLLAFLVVVLNWTWALQPERPAASGQFEDIDRFKIHYVEQNSSAKKASTVVLLHGLPGSTEDWETVVPLLKDRRTVAIDRPGFGYSEGGTCSLGCQADVVHRLLSELDVERAVVVGHSYGGALALALAARHAEDVSSLVLVAPAAGGMRNEFGDLAQARLLGVLGLPVIRQAVDITFGNVLKKTLANQGTAEAFDPNPVVDNYKERLLAVNLRHNNLQAMKSNALDFNESSRWLDSQYEKIKKPAVVIQGRGDKLVNPRYSKHLAVSLPEAKLQLVSGGHMVFYGHQDLIAAAVKKLDRR